MNTKVFKVKGMHCASCVSLIERTVGKLSGVQTINVNLTTETAKAVYDEAAVTEELIIKAIESKGYKVVPEAFELQKREAAELRAKLIWSALFAAPVFAISMLVPAGSIPFQGYILMLLAFPVQFIIGREFYIGAWANLKSFSAGMDTLVALGTSAAYFYSAYLLIFGSAHHLYFETSSVLITVILFGRFLEKKAKENASDAIQKLINLRPRKAFVLRDGKEIEMIANALEKGDVVLVKPGGSIPADGEVIKGETRADESLITGESKPVHKSIGSKVLGGSINLTGAFHFRVERAGDETQLANIIRIVEDAQGSKAPSQRLADRVAGVFVPLVITAAIFTFAGWMTSGKGLEYSLMNAVAVLVIACPCALGLATPAAVLVGSGLASSKGILIKDAAALENLAKIKFFVFDKTGTLTKGKPVVSGAHASDGSSVPELMLIAAGLEKNSAHPAAEAITRHVTGLGLAVKEASNFLSHTGEGVSGIIDGTEYFAGSAKFIAKHSAAGAGTCERFVQIGLDQGMTVVIVASNEKCLGVITVSDVIREKAGEVVKYLTEQGVTVFMATGDNEKTAYAIASRAGITNVFYGVLPEAKAIAVKELKRKGLTAFSGDGVNDAPALAEADVGIAFASGSDVAAEAGNIVLMKSEIEDLRSAYIIGKKTRQKIWQNLFWAFIYNIVGIPLAALGYLNPMIAGTAMALSSVSVVVSSLMLKRARI